MSYLKDELSGFIPEEISGEIIKDVARGSSIIRLSKAEEMKTDGKESSRYDVGSRRILGWRGRTY